MAVSVLEYVDYKNIRWYPHLCKRCLICIQICPKQTLALRHDRVVEEENCIQCELCERYCPDYAIEVIPEKRKRGRV